AATDSPARVRTSNSARTVREGAWTDMDRSSGVVDGGGFGSLRSVPTDDWKSVRVEQLAPWWPGGSRRRVSTRPGRACVNWCRVSARLLPELDAQAAHAAIQVRTVRLQLPRGLGHVSRCHRQCARDQDPLVVIQGVAERGV